MEKEATIEKPAETPTEVNEVVEEVAIVEEGTDEDKLEVVSPSLDPKPLPDAVQEFGPDKNAKHNEKFELLISMGFRIGNIEKALQMTDNVEDAAAIILAMGDQQLSFRNQNPDNPGAYEDDEIEEEDEYKMVIVVRRDLKMKTGKIAAQVGHGVLGAYKRAMLESPFKVEHWEENGQPKIVLKVQTQEELEAVRDKADTMGVISCCIRDAGRTQIPRGSMTVCAIGPDKSSLISEITGKLKLL